MFGRVEVWRNNSWGTVTKDNFGDNDAKVACRQLGLEPGGVMNTKGAASGEPIWMDNLSCSGSESALDQCSQTSLGADHRVSRGKSHSNDIGV